uniref:Uncharacterized protein n=1 Tax=Oryza sativa subsp. japonica TaxID=39947 RepID=Q6H824_ORYSJ|nr:hypothetical protein [Oryza sativa Japonica Group]
MSLDHRRGAAGVATAATQEESGAAAAERGGRGRRCEGREEGVGGPFYRPEGRERDAGEGDRRRPWWSSPLKNIIKIHHE